MRSRLLLLAVASLGAATPAPAQVWGTVVDTAGRPLTKAMVDLSGPGFMRRTGPDAQGRFIIWDAPPGRTLTVQALDDHGGFSQRRTIVAPDTVPPLTLPVRRYSRGVHVDSAQVSRDIRQRDPETRGYGCVGEQCAMSYVANVGRLYCWTIVLGASGPRTIRHVWYWEDREMAQVDQVVRGPTWRTWSSKRIDPSWNGRWRIDIRADDGTLLATRYFYIDSDRDTVPAGELRRVVSRTVYDAVRYLRPRWLTWRPRPAADIVEPRVYVDGVFRGRGWIATNDLPLAGVKVIRRVMGDEARHRWGAELTSDWALDIQTRR